MGSCGVVFEDAGGFGAEFWPVFESAEPPFFGLEENERRRRRPAREGALEIEAMVTDLRLGVTPRVVPMFLKQLAEDEGGVVHSAEAVSYISEVFRVAAVRLFAVDMLASGLGCPEGRAMAAAALSATRFGRNLALDDQRVVFETLLVPEEVLSFVEMGRMLSGIPSMEIRNTAPTLFLAVRALLLLPSLARALFPTVFFDGAEIPQLLAHAVSPGSFVGGPPAPQGSAQVCGVSLRAAKEAGSNEQLAAAALHCWARASGKSSTGGGEWLSQCERHKL